MYLNEIHVSKPEWHFLTFLALLEGVVPGKPRDLTVIEATKNYVVLSWKPPGDKGYEGVMYYVEKVQNPYTYHI